VASVFSLDKILGDFFLRNAHGEENFSAHPKYSKLNKEKICFAAS